MTEPIITAIIIVKIDSEDMLKYMNSLEYTKRFSK